jgi:2-dehydro-3-deoxyphosphogluconate aldolase/(4S)-4-hydroxy-2-oxoglutarate aldolase
MIAPATPAPAIPASGMTDLFAAPVIPVLTIGAETDAVGLCGALAAGGLTVLEITLRTPAALDAIRAVRQALPQCLVGAGTVLTPGHLTEALGAGAQFIVTPGTPASMLAPLNAAGVPALPGCATVTEMLTLREAGFRTLKFFPAEQAGGHAYLKSVGAPLADLAFCPTGGIDALKARDYLALPNVVCVGGSWVVPPAMVAAQDWAGITALARAAAALTRARMA